MARVGRSVVQSAFANFASIGVAIALVIIVSRLLPPDVVGVFVMAFAVVFFIDQLREFQLPSWVARLPELNAAAMGPVRSMALATTALAMLASLAAAAVFHFAFREGEVATCIAIMTVGFALRPWSQPAMALLARDMRYGAIAGVKLAASATRLVVTLGLILYASMGAEALAWGVVAEFTLEAVSIAFIRAEFRFSAPARTGLRDIIRFCSQYTLATTLIQVAVALAPLLIGGYQGLAMAALYNRGTAVTRLLRSGVERAVLLIAMTQFAKVGTDLARLRATYGSGLGMLTSVSWPALAVFVILAEPVVLILFGKEWAGTVPLAQVLGLAAIVQGATALSHQVHASLGNTARIMRRESIDQTLYILVVVATAPISALAVVYGMLAMSFVSFALHFTLLRREIALGPADYLAFVWRSVFVTSTSIAGLSAALILLDRTPETFIELGLAVFAAASGWTAGALLVRSPLIGEFRALFTSEPSARA